MEFHQQYCIWIKTPQSRCHIVELKVLRKSKSFINQFKSTHPVPGTMLEVEDKEKCNSVSDLNEITVY